MALPWMLIKRVKGLDGFDPRFGAPLQYHSSAVVVRGLSPICLSYHFTVCIRPSSRDVSARKPNFSKRARNRAGSANNSNKPQRPRNFAFNKVIDNRRTSVYRTTVRDYNFIRPHSVGPMVAVQSSLNCVCQFSVSLKVGCSFLSSIKVSSIRKSISVLMKQR